MTKLERKWWFSTPVLVVALLLTLALMSAAGVPRPSGFHVAYFSLYGLCAAAMTRLISFLAWLAVLYAAPKLARG